MPRETRNLPEDILCFLTTIIDTFVFIIICLTVTGGMRYVTNVRKTTDYVYQNHSSRSPARRAVQHC